MQLPIRPIQMAYFVTDIRAAARRASETLGAGPFFVFDRIELAWGEHRGQRCDFTHSSAYGQWGDLMMELVQQDVEGPSPFRDLYNPGEEGLHAGRRRYYRMTAGGSAALRSESERLMRAVSLAQERLGI